MVLARRRRPPSWCAGEVRTECLSVLQVVESKAASVACGEQDGMRHSGDTGSTAGTTHLVYPPKKRVVSRGSASRRRVTTRLPLATTSTFHTWGREHGTAQHLMAVYLNTTNLVAESRHSEVLWRVGAWRE